MEKKNKECDIITDLLPIYLEHDTQEETNRFIEEHLVTCEECRKNYEWMKGSFVDFTGQKKEQDDKKKKKNIKVFKKVKLKILLYGYVLMLVLIWLYCNLDLMSL